MLPCYPGSYLEGILWKRGLAVFCSSLPLPETPVARPCVQASLGFSVLQVAAALNSCSYVELLPDKAGCIGSTGPKGRWGERRRVCHPKKR